MALPLPVSAEDVSIAAADTICTHNISMMPITVSNGWVRGMDFTGEWVEYQFTISGFGVNESNIVAMGTIGVPFSVRMILTGSVTHTVQTINFNFTGSGFLG